MNKIDKNLDILKQSLKMFELEGIEIERTVQDKVESYIRDGKTGDEIFNLFVKEYTNAS